MGWTIVVRFQIREGVLSVPLISDRFRGPIKPSKKVVFSKGVKLPKREAGHSSAFNVEAKNLYIYYP
jgi:hypothetical protein